MNPRRNYNPIAVGFLIAEFTTPCDCKPSIQRTQRCLRNRADEAARRSFACFARGHFLAALMMAEFPLEALSQVLALDLPLEAKRAVATSLVVSTAGATTHPVLTALGWNKATKSFERFTEDGVERALARLSSEFLAAGLQDAAEAQEDLCVPPFDCNSYVVHRDVEEELDPLNSLLIKTGDRFCPSWEIVRSDLPAAAHVLVKVKAESEEAAALFRRGAVPPASILVTALRLYCADLFSSRQEFEHFASLPPGQRPAFELSPFSVWHTARLDPALSSELPRTRHISVALCSLRPPEPTPPQFALISAATQVEVFYEPPPAGNFTVASASAALQNSNCSTLLYMDLLSLWGKDDNRPAALCYQRVHDFFGRLTAERQHVGDLSLLQRNGIEPHTIPPLQPAHRPRGLLLYGPMGTNKSNMAYQLIHGLGVRHLWSGSSPELHSLICSLPVPIHSELCSLRNFERSS